MSRSNNKPVSIYDIAKIVGVSAATVSNVLNNKGKCSEKTRAAVLEIARREGYVTNLAAKGLRQARSNSIGILTPDVSNDFYSNLVLHVESLMHQEGFTSFICNTGNNEERAKEYTRDMIKRSIDGIVFIGGVGGEDVDLIGSTPCVFIDHYVLNRPAISSCISNDFGAMAHDQAEYLISKKCRHIAFMAVDRRIDIVLEQPHYLAYAKALQEHGIPLDKNLLMFGPHKKSSTEEAAEMVAEALDRNIRIDAIMAIGDRLAMGATRELLTRGVDVGNDVRVIGIDNSLYSRLCTPQITTIDRHTKEMSYLGAQALVKMIKDGHPVPDNLEVMHEIIERETT